MKKVILLIVLCSITGLNALVDSPMATRPSAGDTIAIDDVYDPIDTVAVRVNQLNDSLEGNFLRFKDFQDSTIGKIKCDSIRSNPDVDSLKGLNAISGNPLIDSAQINVLTGLNTVRGNPDIDSLQGLTIISGNPSIDSISGLAVLRGNPDVDSICGMNVIRGNPDIDSISGSPYVSPNLFVYNTLYCADLNCSSNIDAQGGTFDLPLTAGTINGVNTLSGNPVIDSISGMDRISGNPLIDSAQINVLTGLNTMRGNPNIDSISGAPVLDSATIPVIQGNVAVRGNLTGTHGVTTTYLPYASAATTWGNSPLITDGIGVYIEKQNGTPFLGLYAYGNTATLGGLLQLGHFRGTVAAADSTQTGDVLGQIDFQGIDTNQSKGARIQAVAAAEWGSGLDATDNPTNLLFFTCPDGSGTLTERQRITSEGLVGINSNAPTNSLTVTGGIVGDTVLTSKLRVGSGSGTVIDSLYIFDGSADTLGIKIGAKIWKFLPVGNL